MVARNENIRTVANNSFFQEVLLHLQEGKEVKIAVVGESMQPFLRGGDQVLLKSVREEKLTVGQIVLATYNNAYVLHRLVGIRRGKLMLAGDANYTQIEYVKGSDVKAVITQAYRKNNKLSVQGWQSRLSGLIWYRMRMCRRLYNKLVKN